MERDGVVAVKVSGQLRLVRDVREVRDVMVVDGVEPPPPEPDAWAEQTRRVLTRDLLVRARHCPPDEGRALQFRALHLNLPLIGEVADALGLTVEEREAVEHRALDGLFEAVRLYDPWDVGDFAAFATPFIRAQMLATSMRGRRTGSLPRRTPASERYSMRLVVRRAAQAMAGYHA
jgi:hypothetical protein